MAFGFVVLAGCGNKAPRIQAPAQETGVVSAKIVPTANIEKTLVDMVASHTDATSCWSIISGDVYDLTTYINQHPGGNKPILAACGKDATAMFDTKHGMDPQKWAALQQFKVMVK